VTASDSILSLDDCSIRPLAPNDFPLVERLLRSVPRSVFELPVSDVDYRAWLAGVSARAWSMPMTCTRDGVASGLCFLSTSQLKHLHAYVVALFDEPAESTLCLALYLRQAFWSFPLHRLYTQLPARGDASPHERVFLDAAFQAEGVLRSHIRDLGEAADANVLGLLRPEFDAWCRSHEPRLALERPR
jgi:hypothetical protein